MPGREACDALLRRVKTKRPAPSGMRGLVSNLGVAVNELVGLEQTGADHVFAHRETR
jgi:hypothetical protein